MAHVLLVIFGHEESFAIDLIDHQTAEEVAEELRARGCTVTVASHGGLMKIQVPRQQD